MEKCNTDGICLQAPSSNRKNKESGESRRKSNEDDRKERRDEKDDNVREPSHEPEKIHVEELPRSVDNVNENQTTRETEETNDTSKSSKHAKKDTNRKSVDLSDDELERRRNALLQQLHADPEESE